MTLFRIHKTKDFTIMSNTHFKERGMSLKAKGLLSLMLSLPDDWSYNIKGLCALSKDGKDSVMSALSELEKFGYLTRTRETDSKGRFTGVRYDIFETPQRENPMSEKQNSVNPNSDSSNSENRGQLITNSINHLEDINTNVLERESSEDEIYEILSEISDSELRELYTDYVLQRRENGNPLTPKGLRMLIVRGFRLSDSNMAIHRAIVETAIINNWLNLYAPREEEKLGRNGYLEERKRYYLGDG